MSDPKYTVNNISLDRIRNRYEEQVIAVMNQLLPSVTGFDNCQLCIEDVYALSMRFLPSTYVQKGGIVLKNPITKDDINTVVKYAIQQVMDHPNHD